MAQQFNKKITKQGDGQTYPKKGDTVTMEYTGNWRLHGICGMIVTVLKVGSMTLMQQTTEEIRPNNKNRFDSSLGREDFKTAIGVGRVIQGIPYTRCSEELTDYF
ncbi:hypothetical protein LTS08_008739 [Lithohypha guttulata]|nr:hypothetical protein LTS08_008739 [Lithohypha guttulata]